MRVAAALLLALACAGAGAADAQLGRVEVQGEAVGEREKKTLGPTSCNASSRTLWKSPRRAAACQCSSFL